MGQNLVVAGMRKPRIAVYLVLLSLILLSVEGATLEGSIYNSDLELEENVLVEVSTTPRQKYLSKDGTYSLELPKGEYTITVSKGLEQIIETVMVNQEGKFNLDLFFLPDFTEETALLEDSEELFLEKVLVRTPWWSYVIAGAIIVLLISRFVKLRKKYGSLKQFRAKVQEESAKTVENNPQYLDQAVEIIRKHDGRIHQKVLRQELLHLSEAKVSLIVTELEHKGLIEKFKKGRGNIIILK